MQALYEDQSGVRVDTPAEDELDSLLLKLDGTSNSFASLTKSNGSYIQVGGGPEKYTVEIRIIQEDGAFSHLKAGKHVGKKVSRTISVGGALVALQERQLLNIEEVKYLFHCFLNGHDFDANILWEDITKMFEGKSEDRK